MEYFFILDLSFHEELKVFLPTLYINSSTEIRYIEKIANEKVLFSFGLHKNNISKELNRVLEIVALLQPETLKERFSKKVKKGNFLDDKPLANFYFQYIDDRLHELIVLCNQQHFNFCLNLYNEKDFFSKKIELVNKQIEVRLHFNKTTDGLEYELALVDNAETYFPFQEKIFLITNTTFWFVLNNKLVQLKK